jgi:L-alanine-DL-glutamate epimerase-like enolase superfamily enzyme
MPATPTVERMHLAYYTVPTASFGVESAETDGTAQWDSIGVLVAEVAAGGTVGIQTTIWRAYAAREAIGPDVTLFVDANGAYDRKQALWFAERFATEQVTWFEEPVSSDDLAGLRLIRDRAPSGMQIAAGECGYTPTYLHAMLAAGTVDTIQADSTRCGGATGFSLAAAAAQGAGIPLSAHTAPAIHASLGAAAPNIERLFFDGIPAVDDGFLIPHPDGPGHGLTLKSADAAPYLTTEWTSHS